MNKQFSTKSLVTMALFAALLAVSAYISIPLPNGSHLTILNFVVLLIAFLFPVGQSALIIGVWLLLGAVGIPVFISGASGLGYLFGGWGGYNFAFLVVAIIVPLVRGREYQRFRYTVLALAAALAINVIGAAWLMLITHVTPGQAFIMGVLPFLPLDFVKAVVLAQIVPQLRGLMSYTA